jgi:prephenate dehydrogenase
VSLPNMVLVSLLSCLDNEGSKQISDSSATKLNAIVAGQTSVKAPEKAAFEKYLPEDAYILSIHSLHGPTVSPFGQPLVGASSHFLEVAPAHFQ